MKLVFANDSFKGSLTSKETALLLDKAAQFVFKDVETVKLPLSDGGAGLLDAVISASGGRVETVAVHDPLMGLIEAPYVVIKDKLAVIDMTAVCGIELLDDSIGDEKLASSYGMGELIRSAIDCGCEYIVAGTGEVATNDGGMGALRALGAKFLDEKGRELEGRSEDVDRLAEIDLSEIDNRITDISFTLMCDIPNPIEGMQRYTDILYKVTGHRSDNVIGTGAAGGFGAAAYAVLGAELRSGIDTMLGMVKFDSILEGSDLLITGTSIADEIAANSGVMQGVAKRAKAKGIPVIALVESLGEGWEEVLGCGVSKLVCISGEGKMTDNPEGAAELYYEAAVRMFENYREGNL
ncbi:MAG: glycerate kinase [Mogibacterium sp.]|nr:glycerate kinase [Mogibacterium sp.]